MRAVKDGQLAWLGIVFSASTSYEIFIHSAKFPTPDWAGPTLASAIALLTFSSVLAAFGATFPVPGLISGLGGIGFVLMMK